MKKAPNLLDVLGDPTRRELLERLLAHEGQRPAELAASLGLKRERVSHHLRVLERAGLVRSGRLRRERRYVLRPEPLRDLVDQWLRPFVERSTEAEEDPLSRGRGEHDGPRLVLHSYIRSRPEGIWAALTVPMLSPLWFFGLSVTWLADGRVEWRDRSGTVRIRGEVLEWEQPWRLCVTWHAVGEAEMEREGPSRVLFRVDDLGGWSRLTVRHDRFGRGRYGGRRRGLVYRRMARAWRPVLDSLKSVLEGRRPLTAREGYEEWLESEKLARQRVEQMREVLRRYLRAKVPGFALREAEEVQGSGRMRGSRGGQSE